MHAPHSPPPMNLARLAALLPALCLLAPAARADEPVSFRNDVSAVLSKAGCNMGACHGNKNGKGGLKLSLRGEDPAFDFAALTRQADGRRANPLDPDASLILLKPTMRVAHEGGRRFGAESPEYDILRRWIAAGTPNDLDAAPRLVRLDVTPPEAVLADPEEEIRIRAEAVYGDGTRRNVSRLAVYEPAEPFVEVSADGLVRRRGFGETTVTVRYLDRQTPVRVAFIPARPDFAWSAPRPANFIDEHVFAKLRRLRINPSEICDDTTFLRRACLDLTGVIPTAEEARAFLKDPRSDKRERLVDELLARQEFADFWALRWADLLRAEEKTLDQKGVENYYSWIRNGLATGKPMDQFARELVAARGSTYENPAANYYRAMRDPLTRAESTAQVFLGVRLQCAKCHNHPFDRWTQDDYYGWASLFARVDYKVLENRRRDKNDKHEFDGEQVVFMKSKGDVENPATGAPQPPRVLADGAAEVDPKADRLRQLAEWLTSPENDRFAEMMVNRVWSQLLGRGIVDPIDDFRATNPPANPELLDALAADFVAHGYDLRHLIRTIMRSRVYQLSAEPNGTNTEDERQFSHAYVRRLTAEQTLDSAALALGTKIKFAGFPNGMRSDQLPGVQAMRFRRGQEEPGDDFLRAFGKPPRLQSCDCERSDEATLNQTFQLISGPFINDLLTRSDNRLAKLLERADSDEEIVRELYRRTLSREPSAEELAAAAAHLAESADRRPALEDVAWALLNSNEFMLRR